MVLKNFEADNVDLDTLQIHLTLGTLQDALKLAENLNKLVGEEIDIKADKHRQKRSLNANSYLRVLEGKIADVLGADKNEIHNDMLARYGQYQKDGEGNILFCLYKADMDYRGLETLHLKPTGHMEDRKGVKYAWFATMKPSHEYDTKEMAKLIDGVISEAKELDIDTLTPDEVKRMVSENGNS